MGKSNLKKIREKLYIETNGLMFNPDIRKGEVVDAVIILRFKMDNGKYHIHSILPDKELAQKMLNDAFRHTL